MNVFTSAVMGIFFLFAVGAQAKPLCKKGAAEISCEDVDKAKREAVCWNTEKKGEITEELKAKKCQMAKKSKKMKKKMKKKKEAATLPSEG